MIEYDIKINTEIQELWRISSSIWKYGVFHITLINCYNIDEIAQFEIFNWRYEWVDDEIGIVIYKFNINSLTETENSMFPL